MSDQLKTHQLIIIGGGAAGFFGAITAGEAGLKDILILEKGPEILTKVRISGGGRCNVTHDCYDPRELITNYPRGHKNLVGPFHRFQPADTITWFESHGVDLKVEDDGRMFPVTNTSQTIIDCLTNAARDAGITWRTHCGVDHVRKIPEGFEIETNTGELHRTRNLLIATGGIRSKHARTPAENLGHQLSDPVPSLFTFKINDPRLFDLQGVSVPHAQVKADQIETEGPLLITHWGLSGPAILKNSAWGARSLAENDYKFTIEINWTGHKTKDDLDQIFADHRRNHGVWKVVKRSLIEGITKRLWQRMCHTANIGEDTTWSNITKSQTDKLTNELIASKFQVEGKSLNKDEFVTCGGVALDDLQLKTMESKTVPHLYFAGEVLDLDGITGGFNFQAAWTTGYLAGQAIAAS